MWRQHNHDDGGGAGGGGDDSDLFLSLIAIMNT